MGRGKQFTLGVVAMAGILIGVLPPYLNEAVARYQADSASDDLLAAFSEARALAASRKRPVNVVVDERNRAVSVEGGTWRKLPGGIAVAGPESGGILFRPDGTSSGGQVVLSRRGLAVSVLVDGPSGKVRRVLARGRA
jgi:hypothetical protein